MRLTTRFVSGALAITGALATVLVLTVDGRLRAHALEQEQARLGREALLLGAGLVPGALASVARDAANALGVRVTLVARDGALLADSDLPLGTPLDPERLSNRPEIAGALAGRPTVAQRRDRRDGAPRLYVAVPASVGVVRLDRPVADITAALDRARRILALSGLAATLLSGGLAFLVGSGVSVRITGLRDVARSLAAGDLTRRPALSAPGEVGELASAVHRLAEAFAARIDAHSAEDALMNATLEALHEGVVAVDARGSVARMNETARRLLGVRDALPMGTDLLPRDRALREALSSALAGMPTELVETTLGERTLALAARPLTPGGAVLAVLDLTAQRRLETVRRDFVANVSHELKTPLTVVSGFADTLLDPELPPAVRLQFAETIRSHAQRMQRIVDDLLDLSRIESGGWIPNPVDLDLASLATEATAVAGASARQRGVLFEVELVRGAEQLWADATAMRQILSNLADNAVRHTTAGQVAVYAVPSDNGVLVGVRDSGVGIPAEHLPRIFERFYRVDPSRSREQGGTGLGLAIVRHLVEAHGGHVAAQSLVGQGTTVTCWFPNRGGRAA